MDTRERLPFNENKNRKLVFYLVILLAGLIALAAIFLWTKLTTNESISLERQLKDASVITVNPVANYVDEQIRALQRMADRWIASGGLSKEVWLADATNYYNDKKVYESILYVDSTGIIKWIVPDKFIPQLQNINLMQMTDRAQPLQLAKNNKTTVISKIIHFLVGPKGFIIVVPLFVGERFDGYLLGAVNVQNLFQQIFINGLGENYNLAVYQDTERVFTSDGDLTSSRLVQEKTLKLNNIEWRFYVWPTTKFINSYYTHLPLAILIGGLLISGLMLVISYVYYQAILNADRALKTQLQAERVEERLEKIINNVNEGFISFDESGKILDWNPCAEKMLGWKKAEALGQDIYTLVIPKRHREEYQHLISTVKMTDDRSLLSTGMEFKAIKRDGKEFPVEAILFPLKLDHSYTFHAFIRDITQRKKAEADQARYVSIINESHDAIISMDLNGIIKTWNRGAEKLLKYNAREVIGQHMSLIHPIERLTEINKAFARVKQGEHVRNPDTVRVAKDGKRIPVSILATPIQDRAGKIVGVASISRDISERKEIEKLKNEFISIVSHELRTPLTSINGSIALLASEKLGRLPEKAKQLLTIASKNCERLIRLINDILDIEKIEAGKMVFNLQKLDINALIKDVISANIAIADKNEIEMYYEETGKIFVEGDYDRLTQVLTNLLSNAIRYSPNNGSIEIVSKRMRDKVRISVTDHGPGIAKSFQDKIFGKFSQADASDARTRGGTGLGLNIAKMIIEKHRGEISFTTVEGIGTTFFFDLPIITKTVKTEVSV